MNTKDIEMLMTIYNSESFYEAAKTLNYTPSVVSKHIARIEKELGVTLFVRSNRANTVALTDEGEVIIPEIRELHEQYKKIDRTLDLLLKKNENQLKIGVRGRISSYDRDEIIADFVSKYPEVRVEIAMHDYKTLLNLLQMGSLDALFLIVQNDSRNYASLLEIMKDKKIESFIISTISDMYMGVSEKEPIAHLDEAPLSTFKDFHIVFNSNTNAMENAGLMDPFLRISEKSGFKIKPLYQETHDMSTFYLALKGKVAIPKLRSTFSYPGIKFIKISDWDTYSISTFLTLTSNNNPAKINLTNCVKEFIV